MAANPARAWPILGLLWLVSAGVLAEPYTVETIGHDDRSEADAARSLAVAEGFDAQVVRSFRKGRGWVFQVRVEGIEDRELAAVTARRLAELTGASVQVLLVAGRDVLPVEELAVAAPSEQQAGPEAPSDPGAQAQADQQSARAEGARLLSALVLAHGGDGSNDERPPGLETWDPVHFRFERAAAIGDTSMRVWHDYWRVGDDVRLELRVLEGDGADSTTVIRGEKAWLLVGGERHEVSAGPTREALTLFEPAAVLEQAASFAAWSTPMPVRVVERKSSDSELKWISLERSDAAEAVLVGIDPTDGRARELTLVAGDDELSWTFADYQEVLGGLEVPLRLESSFDGELREQITVLALELPDSPDPTLFVLESNENP